MAGPKGRQTVCKGVFVVANDKGLHTRPSAELVRCTSSFRAHVNLTYQKTTVNGKSMLGVLMLAAARGAKIRIEAEGVDAEEAVQSLIELAGNKFKIGY